MNLKNNDPIQVHILASHENFRIAAAVVDAWPSSRDEIVAGFHQRLGALLMEKLNGWEWHPYGAKNDTFFVDNCAGFSFWKSTWNDYYLCLMAGNFGAKMAFGVVREKPTIGNRPFCDELFRAVRDIHPSATRNGWWEAVIKMRAPAADWRSPDVLWRMHTDQTFLDNVATQILEVARISEPLIDRLTRKYAPSE